MARFPFPTVLFASVFFVGCAQMPQSELAIPSPNLQAPLMVDALTGPRVAEISKPSPKPVEIAKRPEIAPLPVQAGPIVPAGWAPVVKANAWQWIVIHHSATATGCAAVFDRAHRNNGWDELGYHFVIGNGTGSADGAIEVGTRWPVQKWGAHAKTPDNRFNDYGIGICLVGNFENGAPTAKQLESLTKLTSYLMETYHISAENVIGHGQVKGTDCPGKYMPMAWVKQQSQQKLAEWRSPQTPVNPPLAKASSR